MKRTALVLSVAFCLIFLSTAAFAGDQNVEKSFGQTVYVPAAYLNYTFNDYTQIVITRLIIRNIDPHKPIKVNKVEFYGPNTDNPEDSPYMYKDFLDGTGVETHTQAEQLRLDGLAHVRQVLRPVHAGNGQPDDLLGLTNGLLGGPCVS